MDTASLTSFEGSEGFEIVDRPAPEPDENEVLVDVERCSLNRHDLWIANGDSGRVRREDLPAVLGLDFAGTVERRGPNVDDLERGDRVVHFPLRGCDHCPACDESRYHYCDDMGLVHGGFAEKAAVDSRWLTRIPDDVSFAGASVLPTAGVTAYRMLQKVSVSRADTVLVFGASGGVGTSAVQLASNYDCEVVGTTRTRWKTDRLREYGADRAIVVDGPDRVRDLDGLERVDVIIDPLGGGYTSAGTRRLSTGGELVVCGETAGGTASIDVPDVFFGHKEVKGSTLGTREDLETLLQLVSDGEFVPPLYTEFGFTDISRGFETLSKNEFVGKLVLAL